MNLPYVRAVNYLSPSSLRQLEENPSEFYLRRLGPSEFMPPREEQGFPAAVGTAFDGFVKRALADQLGLKCPGLAYLLREVTTERERAIDMGRELLKGYVASGAFDALVAEGPGMLAVTFEDYAPDTEVPVQVKLDAITTCGGELTVHDWKVRGAGRPGAYSPTPGFNRLFVHGVSKRKAALVGGHARAGEPLEALNPDWATQLALYGWLAGKPVEPVIASIDEVVVEEGGGLRVAQFRARISREFQLELRARLIDAWTRIKEERVVPPEIAEHGFELVAVMQ